MIVRPLLNNSGFYKCFSLTLKVLELVSGLRLKSYSFTNDYASGCVLRYTQTECMYTCMYTYIHTCVGVCMCLRVASCVHACVHACMIVFDKVFALKMINNVLVSARFAFVSTFMNRFFQQVLLRKTTAVW